MGAETEPETSSSGRPFRDWYRPSGYDDVVGDPIWLLNSLTDRKEKFIPKAGPNSKKIVWYSCGPTVYDSAHMGHSRNYVGIDIMRRIMEDYFGYSILFVMNITDVDDKIVVKARRNHLLKQYREHATDLTKVREDTDHALESSIKKQQDAYDEAEDRHQASAKEAAEAAAQSTAQQRKLLKQRDALKESAAGEAHKLTALKTIQKSLPGVYATAESKAKNGDFAGAVHDILEVAGDQVALRLDQQFGATVTDEAVFRKHAQRYENEFFHDMELLGTRKPTVLTRVTEYMPQIVDYVQQIMDNGFAYSSGHSKENGTVANGLHQAEDQSVYFDTVAFERSGHIYPKLNPWAAGSALASDSEANFSTTDKKNPRDFALWKASKAGEPSWPSPWGRGRPGWHIECSAMASCIIGDKVDIHTGGQDLRFPHHDNELAQAEAYYHASCGCKTQWVNYFLHSGHLSIDGLKMSKSLKNFITIREALKDFTASQLRLMYAMQPWYKEMTFGKTMRDELAAKEHIFKHFFHQIDVLLRKQTPVLVYQDPEIGLEGDLEQAKVKVDKCFRDSLDTAGALESLTALIASTNKYIKQREADLASQPPGPSPHPYLLRESAGFVTKILRILGISTAGMDDLGLGGPGLTATSQQLLHVYEAFRSAVAVHPELSEICRAAVIDEDSSLRVGSPSNILDSLTEFRTQVRQAARTLKLKAVMEECDKMRDKRLVDLGVRMEDRPDGSSVWMAEDRETLKAEVLAREKAAQQAQLVKRVKVIDEKKRTYQKALTQSKLPTVQQALKEKYSRFSSDSQDANPTHNAQGEELSATDQKKAKSAADKARKARQYYDTQVKEKGPSFLQELEREINEAEAALSRQ